MGGSSRQTSKSKQETILPGNQQANVDLLMGGAKDFYNSGGPKFFEGQNYTTATPQQVAARGMASNYATGAGQQMVTQAGNANNFWMDPSRVYDLNSQPGYAGMKQGIVDTVGQALLEQWMPSNRSTAVSGGALGGSRQGIMDSLAMGRASGEVGRALSDLDYRTAESNKNMANQALSRAPTMYNLGLAPSQTLDSVGGAERADQAEKLQADMQRWNFDQNKQGQLLAMLQALTGTAGQYGGIVKGKQTTEVKSDPTSQILGGLLMGGSMLMGGMGGGAGAAAPAAGGAGQANAFMQGPFAGAYMGG